MIRSGFRYILAACAVLALLPGCSGTTQSAPNPEPAELTIALAHDTPAGAVIALEGLCNDLAKSTEGKTLAVLQYWKDPLTAPCDLRYVMDQRLFSAAPELQTVQQDFFIRSYEAMNQAMNAQTVLDEITRQIPAGFFAHSTFYCGGMRVCGGTNMFFTALREDNLDMLNVAMKYVQEGNLRLLPADLTVPPEDGVLYYADSEILAASASSVINEAANAAIANPGQRHRTSLSNYTLLLPQYRYRMGFLLIRSGLQEELDPAAYAWLLEAAAGAAPTCDQYYLQLDENVERIFANYASTLPATRKLRTAFSSTQSNYPELQSSFYQLVNSYM